MTKKTAYMLLTCSKEQYRYDAMKAVIDNLKSHPEFSQFDSNLIAFDNASTFSDSKDLLNSSFTHVAHAESNYGYWSPINWFIHNFQEILGREYDYMYLIESDQIHYDWHKFDIVEDFMNNNANRFDSIRMREFIVKDAHLYSKEKQTSASRRWAWCSQKNPFTHENVTFDLIDAKNEIFSTNFVALPPSLNRLTMLKSAFEHLSKLKSFTEKDFWKVCYDIKKEVALLDYGVCHAKLGFGPKAIASNCVPVDKFEQLGYVNCSRASLVALNDMKVNVVTK